MNVGEYGVQFAFGTGFDMSSNTSLSLVFTRPDDTMLTASASLGTTAITTTLTVQGQPVTFQANQWMFYYFLDGDVTVPGQWNVRGIMDNSSASPPEHLISDIGTFIVGP